MKKVLLAGFLTISSFMFMGSTHICGNISGQDTTGFVLIQAPKFRYDVLIDSSLDISLNHKVDLLITKLGSPTLVKHYFLQDSNLHLEVYSYGLIANLHKVYECKSTCIPELFVDTLRMKYWIITNDQHGHSHDKWITYYMDGEISAQVLYEGVVFSDLTFPEFHSTKPMSDLVRKFSNAIEHQNQYYGFK